MPRPTAPELLWNCGFAGHRDGSRSVPFSRVRRLQPERFLKKRHFTFSKFETKCRFYTFPEVREGGSRVNLRPVVFSRAAITTVLLITGSHVE